MFSWLRPKKIYALPELKAIVDYLFPPIQHISIPQKDMEDKEVYVDNSIDANLEQCIINFQDGTAGAETLETLRFCLKQLRKVRLMLDQSTTIPNGSFYVVDAPDINKDLEDIKLNINTDSL